MTLLADQGIVEKDEIAMPFPASLELLLPVPRVYVQRTKSRLWLSYKSKLLDNWKARIGHYQDVGKE